MIDERIADFIHADIDGCLPEGARVELSRRLLADPEARACHRDMLWLRDQLAAIGPEPVPSQVTRSILASIPASGAAASRAANREVQAANRAWRYAGALAAGLAVAAVVLHVGSMSEGVDSSGALGTMVGRHADSSAIAVDGPEVVGSVRLRRSAGSMVVDFDVALHEDVTALALQHDRIVGRAEFAARDGRPQQFSLELPDAADGEAAVTVRFSAQGRVVEELSLESPDRR